MMRPIAVVGLGNMMVVLLCTILLALGLNMSPQGLIPAGSSTEKLHGSHSGQDEPLLFDFTARCFRGSPNQTVPSTLLGPELEGGSLYAHHFPRDFGLVTSKQDHTGYAGHTDKSTNAYLLSSKPKNFTSFSMLEGHAIGLVAFTTAMKPTQHCTRIHEHLHAALGMGRTCLGCCECSYVQVRSPSMSQYGLGCGTVPGKLQVDTPASQVSAANVSTSACGPHGSSPTVLFTKLGFRSLLWDEWQVNAVAQAFRMQGAKRVASHSPGVMTRAVSPNLLGPVKASLQVQVKPQVVQATLEGQSPVGGESGTNGIRVVSSNCQAVADHVMNNMATGRLPRFSPSQGCPETAAHRMGGGWNGRGESLQFASMLRRCNDSGERASSFSLPLMDRREEGEVANLSVCRRVLPVSLGGRDKTPVSQVCVQAPRTMLRYVTRSRSPLSPSVGMAALEVADVGTPVSADGGLASGGAQVSPASCLLACTNCSLQTGDAGPRQPRLIRKCDGITLCMLAVVVALVMLNLLMTIMAPTISNVTSSKPDSSSLFASGLVQHHSMLTRCLSCRFQVGRWHRGSKLVVSIRGPAAPLRNAVPSGNTTQTYCHGSCECVAKSIVTGSHDCHGSCGVTSTPDSAPKTTQTDPRRISLGNPCKCGCNSSTCASPHGDVKITKACSFLYGEFNYGVLTAVPLSLRPALAVIRASALACIIALILIILIKSVQLGSVSSATQVVVHRLGRASTAPCVVDDARVVVCSLDRASRQLVGAVISNGLIFAEYIPRVATLAFNILKSMTCMSLIVAKGYISLADVLINAPLYTKLLSSVFSWFPLFGAWYSIVPTRVFGTYIVANHTLVVTTGFIVGLCC